MKLHGSILMVVLALMMVGEAAAQTVRMKANVPFDFVVNGSTLPAGEYSIQSFGTADGKTLLVKNADLTDKALVNSISVQSLRSAKETKLVFHRYGDRYFLAEVWTEGNDRGNELPKSSREVETAMGYDHHFQEVDIVAAMK